MPGKIRVKPTRGDGIEQNYTTEKTYFSAWKGSK